MPIGLQRCHKALSVSERWQCEDAIQPGEHIATLTQCATQHSPLGVNQVEPETHRGDHQFKG